MIIALDPGTRETGCILLDGYSPIYADVMPNANVIPWLQTFGRATSLACEWVQSYGMPVGAEVFDTVRWIGRFQQAWHSPDAVQFITRKTVCLHICNSPRANDATIRQALLDRYGGKAAVGNKASPGPLYRVKSHAWQALAVGLTAYDGGAHG
jgi:hypothetical protein